MVRSNAREYQLINNRKRLERGTFLLNKVCEMGKVKGSGEPERSTVEDNDFNEEELFFLNLLSEILTEYIIQEPKNGGSKFQFQNDENKR